MAPADRNLGRATETGIVSPVISAVKFEVGDLTRNVGSIAKEITGPIKEVTV